MARWATALQRTILAIAVLATFIELAGPEPVALAEAASTILSVRGDGREIVADPSAGYFGGTVTNESLTPGHDPAVVAQLRGATTLLEWNRAHNDGE